MPCLLRWLRFAPFFAADVAPWEWLKQIGAALEAADFGPNELVIPPGVHVEGRVWLHPTVKLPAYATIIGPAWIGAKTEIRPGAFIRGNVIVGEGCVLGNACEFKNCLLLDGVQAPHFNYVGDSILGNGAHLGAGVICSNLRLDQGEVIVRLPTRSGRHRPAEIRRDPRRQGRGRLQRRAQSRHAARPARAGHAEHGLRRLSAARDHRPRPPDRHDDPAPGLKMHEPV